MPTITALEPGRRHRLRVFLEGRFGFSIDPVVAAGVGLAVGQELSLHQIEELAGQDLFQRACNAALRLLGYRPRSVAELSGRLLRRFPPETVEKVTARLQEQGFLDDAEFARFWREGRERGSPRSPSLLRRELKAKGISEAVAAEATQGVDEAEAALRAARPRAQRLVGSDYPQFRLKLTGFLRRRGFGWEVVRHTIDQLWQERD